MLLPTGNQRNEREDANTPGPTALRMAIRRFSSARDGASSDSAGHSAEHPAAAALSLGAVVGGRPPCPGSERAAGKEATADGVGAGGAKTAGALLGGGGGGGGGGVDGGTSWSARVAQQQDGEGKLAAAQHRRRKEGGREEGRGEARMPPSSSVCRFVHGALARRERRWGETRALAGLSSNSAWPAGNFRSRPAPASNATAAVREARAGALAAVGLPRRLRGRPQLVRAHARRRRALRAR